MSLIFIVDKLEETQLQDRLVRSITNLQNDAEPSIRTNATIFLGKIASKLKEPVRVRVLCVAFQKAMKDNFMHCRVAGLRTANACVKLLDAAQMASKLVPQASILLLDKSAEVRSLAFTLIESCLDALRLNHEAMAAKTKADGGANVGSLSSTPSKQDLSSSSFSAPPGGAARSSSAGGGASSTEDNNTSSGWSSWSVLQGISKSLESATIVASSNSAELAVGGNKEGSATAGALAQSTGVGAKSSSALKPSTSTTSNNSDSMVHRAQRDPSGEEDRGRNQSYGFGGSDGDDLDFDPDMHDDDHDYALGARKKNSNQGRQQGQQQGAGWDEDFDDLGLDDDDEGDGDHRASGPVLGGRLGGLGVAGPPVSKPASAAPKGMSLKQEAPSASGNKAPKAPKVAVTKLSVSKGEDNWDDF